MRYIKLEDIYTSTQNDLRKYITKGFLKKHKRCGLDFDNITGTITWNQKSDPAIAIFPGSFNGEDFIVENEEDRSLFCVLYNNGYKYVGEMSTESSRKAVWELERGRF